MIERVENKSYSDLAGMMTSPMYNVVCISMIIEARHAASARGNSRIEMQAMYSAVYLEKFALTETTVYSACHVMEPTPDGQSHHLGAYLACRHLVVSTWFH
jgi:hypothetical protein